MSSEVKGLAALFGAPAPEPYRRKVYTCVACEKDKCTEDELFCPECWKERLWKK